MTNKRLNKVEDNTILFLDEDKLRIDQFIALQKANERKLEQFIEFFEYAVYKFSWILNYGHNPVGGNNHTHGGVANLLGQIKLPRKACEEWVKEPEHGFFHSFCVLYLAYCLHQDKQWLWNDLSSKYTRKRDQGFPRFAYVDKLIVSCLLHDIMRYIKGDENHDINLKELTDCLLPETYTHSNPQEESLLVQADRLELMRYHDHTNWVDFQKLNPSIQKYGGRKLIDHFYKHIRPVLQKMFVGRKDIWFSHALEVREHPIWKHTDEKYLPPNVKDNLGVSHYPKFYWIPIDPGYTAYMKPEYEKWFSVHSGRLPFGNCMHYTKGYYRAQAVIDKQTVKQYGCDISCAPPTTAGRDHLFIVQNQKIPTKEWCFLYDFGTNQENQFNQIELNDLRTVKAKLFNNIHRATELFLNYLECLCYED